MTTNPRVRTSMGIAAAVLLVTGIAIPAADAATARRQPNGAVRFYDDRGQDRGYAWCLQRNDRRFGSGSLDCSYYTYAQCRASIIDLVGGYCQPNPWAAYAAPPQRRRR